MSNFNPRWLVGKTIARVEMNTKPCRDFGKETASEPEIFFTDGSHVAFYTQETDHGYYGTGISYYRAKP